MRGHAYGLLARSRVGDEQDFLRLEKFAQAFHFRNEHLINFLPSGGVVNFHVVRRLLEPLQSELGRCEHVFLADWRSESGHAELATKRCELLDGRRAIKVTRDEHGSLTLFAQPVCELTAGRRFPRAIQSDDEDSRGRREHERGRITAEQSGQFIMENFDDLLTGRD